MRLLISIAACIVLPLQSIGQDKIALINGDTLHGEVKSMNQNVLRMETDYSDSDFKIEWDKVTFLKTSRFFSITLSDGSRYSGSIQSSENNNLTVVAEDGERVLTRFEHIVYLKQVDRDFWSRLSASIDLGLSYAKTNNLTQASARSNLGYLTDKWQAELSFNSVYSTQDNVSNVRRVETNIGYSYFLPDDWFIQGSMNFLTNTEQLIDLRTTSKLGGGNYVVHTNSAYWAFGGGIASNMENFAGNETEDRKSAEAYIGTEVNLFDAGDLKFVTTITSYTGLTEEGRFRVDGKLDIKYDLPLDFYVGFGISLNYDNQPVEVDGIRAQETDYVSQITFGWSL